MHTDPLTLLLFQSILGNTLYLLLWSGLGWSRLSNQLSLLLFQSVCCALLASLPLCLSESASGLSHVVKVGRNGRQVVHQAQGASKGNGGKSLGRKVSKCPMSNIQMSKCLRRMRSSTVLSCPTLSFSPTSNFYFQTLEFICPCVQYLLSGALFQVRRRIIS